MSEEPAGEASPTTPPYPLPLNEAARQAALDALSILDTKPDPRFDRLARLAAKLAAAPIARLTFVDNERTWYKATYGADTCDGARCQAICAHTIMADQPLIVPDLTKDPRFSDSPKVVGPPHLRFYAGVPLCTDDGYRVGALCVQDTRPRPKFGAGRIAALSDLAEIVMEEVKLHGRLERSQSLLDMARREAEEAELARERFLAIMSHELRTPINAVGGLCNMMVAEKFGPLGSQTYRDFARAACDAAARLDLLVDRVLKYASAREGDLQLCESVVDVPALVERCVSTALVSATLADVEIVVDRAADTPASVLADEVQLAEMLHQLLGNAVSASVAGQTVTLRLSAVDDGLAISVSDQGRGLEPEEAFDALKAFALGDDSPTRGSGGIGLGLPLTQALAKLHGGYLVLPIIPAGFCAEIRLPAWRNQASGADGGQLDQPAA